MNAEHKILIEQIYNVFAEKKPPYKFKILKSFDAWRYDPEEFFSSKSWVDVLESNWVGKGLDLSDVPIFMTRESFYNFLPAFMVITLNVLDGEIKPKYDWNITSQIERYLLDNDHKDFELFVKLFTDDQLKITAKFLYELFMHEVDNYGSSYPKFDSQEALEAYWYSHLDNRDLGLFSTLSDTVERGSIVNLSKDLIDDNLNTILEYSKLEKKGLYENQNLSINDFASAVIQLIQNNTSVTDEILITLSKDEQLTPTLRNAVKGLLYKYGIKKRSN